VARVELSIAMTRWRCKEQKSRLLTLLFCYPTYRVEGKELLGEVRRDTAWCR
jgi:hypothetical protein